jgi:hypothetical protein
MPDVSGGAWPQGPGTGREPEGNGRWPDRAQVTRSGPGGRCGYSAPGRLAQRVAIEARQHRCLGHDDQGQQLLGHIPILFKDMLCSDRDSIEIRGDRHDDFLSFVTDTKKTESPSYCQCNRNLEPRENKAHRYHARNSDPPIVGPTDCKNECSTQASSN